MNNEWMCNLGMNKVLIVDMINLLSFDNLSFVQ